MKLRLTCLLTTCLALLPAATLRATFNPAIVPADAQWVVHADLVGLRDTALGQKLIEFLPRGAAQQDPVRPNVRKIMETVGTATAFGTDLSGKPESMDGALVLQGTADLRKIAEGIVAQMSVAQPDQLSEITDLPFEAYVVAKELFVAFPSEPIIVVSKSRAQLVKALEAFRGEVPSLARSKGGLAALLPTGGRPYLIAATTGVPSAHQLFDGTGPEARLLQMAQSGSVALGEDGEMATARVQLLAASADFAVKLVKIVEGIVAMVSLAETSDERLAEFANALKVVRTDERVSLNFSYSTARLLEMIEAAQRPEPEDTGKPAIEGEMIAQWKADQERDGFAPANHTTKPIDLVPGAVVVLTGHRGEGELARWDYVEVTPVAGGAAQRYEAEFMRLKGYAIERHTAASGGEVIKTEREGTARFRFQGPAGRYTLTAHYIDEPDGKATFTLSVLPPVDETK